MPGPSESRGWFERGLFDLAIAAAHLQSGLWLAGAQHARQAGLKFLQSALVLAGEPDPTPRMSELAAEAVRRHPAFRRNDEWAVLDSLASATALDEAQARQAYARVEDIRDAVAAVITRKPY